MGVVYSENAHVRVCDYLRIVRRESMNSNYIGRLAHSLTIIMSERKCVECLLHKNVSKIEFHGV